MNDQTNELQLSIRSDLAQVQPAVAQVLTACEPVFPPNLDAEELTGQIRLALSECLSNTIRHAYDGATDHSITIKVSMRPKEIEIRVLDAGNEFENAPDKIASRDAVIQDDELPEGSMGLFLIFAEMDSVSYSRVNGQNEWELVKRFPCGIEQSDDDGATCH